MLPASEDQPPTAISPFDQRTAAFCLWSMRKRIRSGVIPFGILIAYS